MSLRIGARRRDTNQEAAVHHEQLNTHWPRAGAVCVHFTLRMAAARAPPSSYLISYDAPELLLLSPSSSASFARGLFISSLINENESEIVAVVARLAAVGAVRLPRSLGRFRTVRI